MLILKKNQQMTKSCKITKNANITIFGILTFMSTVILVNAPFS